MSRRRDPDEHSTDVRDVVEWEPQSLSDRAIYRLYALLLPAFRVLLVVAAVGILAAQFALGDLGALTDPVVGLFVVLSALPALVLSGYIRYADVTTPPPLRLLVVTFALGLLFAGFAGVLNRLLTEPVTSVLFDAGVGSAVALPAVFLLVVAPAEECVKLLVVRLYAYRRPEFDTAISGAVYGAVAGLGFATIENALYITQVADSTASVGVTLVEGGSIATRRALAGPGHVIYSAFAGYYLGLAKFNRAYAGPLVVKGLVVAVLVHGWYNVLVSRVPEALTTLLGFSDFAALFTFILAYDGIFMLILVRKLSVYRAAYEETHDDTLIQSERTEFE
jgi:RsiW-degrading membrane proteinase PrsW (M82 family)